jgi:dipeptidyl aminopeptidase/acylaminoacyl peptidase
MNARTLRLSAVSLAALFLCALSPALAADEGPPSLIPRDTLFGNPPRTLPKISPDGTKLAFIAPDDKNVLQIWVQTVGKEDARKVSSDRKRGIRNYSWTWNGDLVYGQDTDGDENNHLHVVNLATNEDRDMTPIAGVRAELVGTSPEVPGQVLVGMNRRDKAVFDVWRLDLATGALTPVETNPGNVGDWIVNRKLQVVGRQTTLPDGGGTVDVRDGKGWRTLRKWGVNDNTGVIAPTPDGKGLLVVTNLGHDTQVVELVDVKSGKGKVVAADPSVDATGFLYDEATDKLQAVGFKRGRLRWEVVDPSIQKDLAALAAVNGGELDVLNRDKAGKTWLVAFSSDLSPARFYAWDRASQKATFLFAARPQLEKERLAPMEVLEIKARDGLSLPAYLTLPPGVPPKDLPMVLFVHGGPWARDEWGYSSVPQWLANRGYAVLQVNYRGSTGFGKKFKNAAMKQFAAKMHDDLIDAVNWAVKTGIANPKRVAILGGSYGGYATLVGMTFTPEVFACGVDIVGPSNLVTLIESFPPYWGPFLASTWYPFVGNPKVPAEKADMEARSPLFKVGEIKKPLLIGQGANDPRVTQKESEQIVAAMEAKGLPVTYVVYSDEGHGFARPENRLDFFARSEAFLADCLGGRIEPLPQGGKVAGSTAAVKVVTPAGAK